MDKFAGIKLASFVLGIVAPVVIVTAAWTHITKVPIPVETETVIEYEPSIVDTFVVDYDQYGSMYVGETIVRCEIVNNSINTTPCEFILRMKMVCELRIQNTYWLQEEPVFLTLCGTKSSLGSTQ